MINFSKKELTRYQRHFSLPDFGIAGQKRLKEASVLCIGAGGLGSSALQYLAAAGVGRIGIVDDDIVEDSNLQRQILFTEDELGKKKALIAKKKLQKLNKFIKIDAITERFDPNNALEIFKNYEILLDGSDNFSTRYLCNDVAVVQKKINIFAAIFRFEGQLSAFAAHLGSPCYRCIFPNIPKAGEVLNCAEAGVLGALPGVMGALQALECIKIIINSKKNLIGKLVICDTLTTRFQQIDIKKDKNCKFCSQKKIKLSNVYENINKTQCQSDQNQNIENISTKELKKLLNQDKNLIIIDVREKFERLISKIPQSYNLPFSDFENQFNNNAKKFAKEKTIYLICQSGIRSQKAALIMKKKGYHKLANVLGGMNLW